MKKNKNKNNKKIWIEKTLENDQDIVDLDEIAEEKEEVKKEETEKEETEKKETKKEKPEKKEVEKDIEEEVEVDLEPSEEEEDKQTDENESDAIGEIGEKPFIEQEEVVVESEQQEEASAFSLKDSIWGQKGAYILVPLICISIFVLIVLSYNVLFVKQKQKNDPKATEGSLVANQPSESTEDSSIPEDTNNYLIEYSSLLKKDLHKDVNSLIGSYFYALKECDVERLNTIVVTNLDNKFTQKNLDKQAQYIELYDNIICYYVEGAYEDTYIVYVYHEVKFINVSTYAPALIRLYIARDEDGNPYIYNGTIDEKVSARIDEMDNDQDVMILKSQVDRMLVNCCAKDEKLDKVVKILSKTTPLKPDATQEKTTENTTEPIENHTTENETLPSDTETKDTSEEASTTQNGEATSGEGE